MALARRDLLLRAHRHRLRAEDLEDCFSQATLELLQRARTGAPFADAGHVSNALEQKMLSRIRDRRRALGGRSPIEAALGQAVTLEPAEAGAGQLADPGLGVDDQVSVRTDLGVLREILRELTPDMRLVLMHQVVLGTECHEFCQRYSWTPEKFRKVAQRARRRLLGLSAEYAAGDRCRRLEPDLLAHVSRVADADQRERIVAHLDNCMACRRRARELRAAERNLLGMLPVGLELGSAGLGGGAVGSAASGTGAAVAGGGVVAWSGSGLVGVKLGVAAVCLVGLAGGGIALCHGGRLETLLDDGPPVARRVAVARRPRERMLATARSRDPARVAVASEVPAALETPITTLRVSTRATSPSASTTGSTPAEREFGFAALTTVTPPPAEPGGGLRRHRSGAKSAAGPRRRLHRAPATVVTPVAGSAASSWTAPARGAPAPRPAVTSAPPTPSGSPAASAGEFGFEHR